MKITYTGKIGAKPRRKSVIPSLNERLENLDVDKHQAIARKRLKEVIERSRAKRSTR